MSANEINPSRRHVIMFDVVITNKFGGYISYLGAFTAPADGVYVFNWNIIAHKKNYNNVQK